MPYLFIVQSIASAIYYFLTDLNKDKIEIFVYFMVINSFGSLLFGTMLGLIISIVIKSKFQLGPATSFLVLPLNVVTGYLRKTKELSFPLRLLSYISGQRYA